MGVVVHVSMVKNEDPSIITALTVCDDLQALEDLTGMPVKEAYLYLLREARTVAM